MSEDEMSEEHAAPAPPPPQPVNNIQFSQAQGVNAVHGHLTRSTALSPLRINRSAKRARNETNEEHVNMGRVEYSSDLESDDSFGDM